MKLKVHNQIKIKIQQFKIFPKKKILNLISQMKKKEVKNKFNQIEKTFNAKVQKLVKTFKIIRTVNLMKNDNLPIEIIDNIFIGSIGASMNKQSLKELEITHIIIAARGLTEYYPEVIY